MKYYFKLQGTKFQEYYVANKLDDDGNCIEQYDLIKGSCNCWAHRRNPPCKHLKMLKAWLNQPEPLKVWYDDQLKKFEPNPFADFDALDNFTGDKDG